MTERRQFVRWSINNPARVRLQGAEAHANCFVRDLSLKGAQIALGLKLRKDAFIKLRLAVGDECVLELEVWVAWHKTVDVTNVYGVYFTKICDGDKEKVYQYVRRNFPKELDRRWVKDSNKEEGGETMDDRRLFERFAFRTTLRFLNVQNGKEGLGDTWDVSAKGVGFVTGEQLMPNTLIELWIKMPDKGEPLYTRGEVVWTKPIGVNEYRTGVCLEKADLMGLSRILRA